MEFQAWIFLSHEFYENVWEGIHDDNFILSYGTGTQKSIVRCVRGVNGVPVSDRRCPPEEKPFGQTIRCNLKPCPAE